MDLQQDQPIDGPLPRMLITSSSNERIKHARRVREGRERDLIFIEGERLVAECVSSGLPLQACFTAAAPSAPRGASQDSRPGRPLQHMRITSAAMTDPVRLATRSHPVFS